MKNVFVGAWDESAPSTWTGLIRNHYPTLKSLIQKMIQSQSWYRSQSLILNLRKRRLTKNLANINCDEAFFGMATHRLRFFGFASSSFSFAVTAASASF